MPGLSTLPDELLAHVIFNIQAHRDVVSLALQNHRFHSLGDLPTRRKFRRARVVPDLRHDQALKMLLQILKKPRLGAYVRHLEFDCFYEYSKNSSVEKDGLQPGDLELLRHAIGNADFVESSETEEVLDALFPKRYKGSLRAFDWNEWHQPFEILAALLASVSPRLESISCCDLGYYQPRVSFSQDDSDSEHWEKTYNENPGSSSYFGKFLDRTSRNQGNTHHLQALREVRFLSDTSRYGDGRFYEETDYYHSLNVIRRLPALERIQFDATSDPEQSISVQPPPHSGSYSKLAFYHSSIRYEVLHAIILSSKALRELAFSLGGRNMLGGYTNHIRPDSLLEALLVHRHTLEYLDIDAEDEIGFDRDSRESQELGLSPAGKLEFEEEWADELGDHRLAHKGEAAVELEAPAKALRNLYQLKHLGLGIKTLCHLARGIGGDTIDRASFSLVDHLPPNLCSLRIYGYPPNDENTNEENSPDENSSEEHSNDEHSHDKHSDDENPGNDSCSHNLLSADDVKDQVSQLMQQKAEKMPLLKTVEGVDVTIPNGKSVDDPDRGGRDLLWQREVEDWSDNEY